MKKLLVIAPINAFIGGIVNKLRKIYDVNVIGKEGVDEIHMIEYFNWADGILFEFANDYLPLVMKLDYKKKLIIRLHRYELYRDIMINFDWTKVDLMINPAEHVKDRFVEYAPQMIDNKGIVKKILPKKQIVIPSLAIDINKFAYRERTYPDDVVISIIGRIFHKKRIYEAIQLMADLPENTHLNVVGEFLDAEYTANIRDLRTTLGLEKRIALVDAKYGDELIKIYQNTDIILSMSNEECGQFSISEGMSTGCYPVIHNWNGADKIYPKKYVHNKFSELIGEIESWIDKSHAEKAELSKQCREFVKDNYEKETIETKIVDEIKKVMEG